MTTGDSEGTNTERQLNMFYEPPQWCIEMVEHMGDLLDEREQYLLMNGPDSLASSWRIQGLKHEWEELTSLF